MLSEVQAAVDLASAAVSRAETIKRFRILDTSFTVGTELTPLQKVRRPCILGRYADDIQALCHPQPA